MNVFSSLRRTAALDALALGATVAAALLATAATMAWRMTKHWELLGVLPAVAIGLGHALAIAFATRRVPAVHPHAWRQPQAVVASTIGCLLGPVVVLAGVRCPAEWELCLVVVVVVVVFAAIAYLAGLLLSRAPRVTAHLATSFALVAAFAAAASFALPDHGAHRALALVCTLAAVAQVARARGLSVAQEAVPALHLGEGVVDLGDVHGTRLVPALVGHASGEACAFVVPEDAPAGYRARPLAVVAAVEGAPADHVRDGRMALHAGALTTASLAVALVAHAWLASS
jgi:hypothetical protein